MQRSLGVAVMSTTRHSQSRRQTNVHHSIVKDVLRHLDSPTMSDYWNWTVMTIRHDTTQQTPHLGRAPERRLDMLPKRPVIDKYTPCALAEQLQEIVVMVEDHTSSTATDTTVVHNSSY